jgi:uncharacterized cupredoxin-like copper-binding protein
MRRILVVLSLLAIVLVGCSDDSSDDPGGEASSDTTEATDTTEASAEPFAFDVTSVDFGYEFGATEVPAGPVEVTQTNEGTVEHQVTLIQLDDGQTPDQLLDTITNDGDDALDPAVFAGGTNSIAPGGSNQALVTLEAGEYVAYCFIPDHAQQGMVEPFTVTGDTAVEASADATETVGLDNFEFDLPDGFTGQGTVEVVNNGDQAHEMTIVHADDQSGAGGLTTIGPGRTGYVDLALEPGDYTLLCFITDPESGQLHFQLGMTKDFTIT